MLKLSLLCAAAMAVPAALASVPVGANLPSMTSPDGSVRLVIDAGGGYSLVVDGEPLLDIAAVGVEVPGKQLYDRPSSPRFTGLRTDDYDMVGGKRLHCTNTARCYSVELGPDQLMELRLYNDGLAYRYILSGLDNAPAPAERSAYRIPEGADRWIQEYDPGYERFFPHSVTGASAPRQWGYPALVKGAGDRYALISEAGIERYHSASKLVNAADPEVYTVTPEWNRLHFSNSWASPWRVVIAGPLAEVVESTLVTDVSPASRLDDTSWIHPGVVSWVYWAYNRGSKDFQIVKKYIEMAADMHLPYVLIDWEWDVMENGGDIDDAIALADSLGVKVLVWYNSSTAWVDNGAGGPLFRLNKPEDREREFAWLRSKGIAGVKIDFFDGDNQPTMEYCIDLLESAARHNLLVNFHGATIPRGWQRTYPNMLSAEAVYGAEWYNNLPVLTDRAACHNATLPFTRNVIGPMDYTPCAFSDSQHPHITSDAHELALTVVFESALQHLADKPESYAAQPQAVRDFLGALPSVWDETRLIGGYPGDYVAIARRSGDTWFVGVLNGTDNARDIPLSCAFLPPARGHNILSYADGPDGWLIQSESDATLPARVSCAPRGGYVAVIRPDNR